jgi:hypothetical protein
MRLKLAMLTLAAATMVGGAAARAEKRVFIIANQADGYGIDRCLASGERCGAAAATSYCRSREFAQAVSYGKIDREEITGAVPAGGSSCGRGGCDHFVAIECTR